MKTTKLTKLITFLILISLLSTLTSAAIFERQAEEHVVELDPNDITANQFGHKIKVLPTIYAGDSIAIRWMGQQEDSLKKIGGDEGPRTITLRPGQTTEAMTFNEGTSGMLKPKVRYKLTSDEEKIVQLSVKKITVAEPPEGRKGHLILLVDDAAAEPANLIMKRGEMVKFLNMGTKMYVVAYGKAQVSFGSGFLMPGDSSTWLSKFALNEGTYEYRIIRGGGLPEKKATITVTSPNEGILSAIIEFVKEKAGPIVKKVVDVFNPPEIPETITPEALSSVGSFERFYMAQNGAKVIIGLTENKKVKGDNAQMIVYYKGMDFNVCEVVDRFIKKGKSEGVSPDDVHCRYDEARKQYEVSAGPNIYNKYWQDFTSKLRLTDSGGE